MKEASDYPVWMGLGINTDTKCITVLAFAMDKEECRRRSAARSPEAGCTSFDVFSVLSGNLKSSMLLWLAENDIYGTEASEIVRDIGRSISQDLKSLKLERIGEKNNPQPLKNADDFPPPVRRSGKLSAAVDAALQKKPLEEKT